jgi:DHA1 family tetracycline resistance protein-like MFS transporter
MSVTSIIGPLVMTSLFAYFTKASNPIYFPGASFLLGAVFMVISGVFAYMVLNKETE